MTYVIRSEVDSNIWVNVLADSISPEGDRLLSLHCHYPRPVLAELNTHKIISKNSTSSRAVPVTNFLETLEADPYIPSFLGKNQAGMQAGEEITEKEKKEAIKLIKRHLKATIKFVKKLSDKEGLNIHKQIANRYTEPFQYMNTILTATEWDGYLKLRNHEAAEPHLHELAKCIQQVYDYHKPNLLHVGEWHLPFIDIKRDDNQVLKYGIIEGVDEDEPGEFRERFVELTLDQAKRVSASCAAQISYRRGDRSLEKADSIFGKLIDSDPAHESPIEHQGTPIDYNLMRSDKHFELIDGITHMDRKYNLWSAQFKGWIMFRKELEHQKERMK